MKQLSTFILLIGLSITSLWAQNNAPAPTAEDRATFLTNQMKDVLKLTDEQVPKVQAINLESAQKIEKVVHHSSLSGLAKLNKVQAIESEKETSLKAVLTKKQFKNFLKIKEKIKEQARQNMLGA